jgi:hypothetical protein
VSVTLSLGDRITLGNGAGDIVNVSEGVSNRITLGNGAGDCSDPKFWLAEDLQGQCASGSIPAIR